MYACTIVARNYLPHARVLAKSFLEHNQGSRFATLLIDDRTRSVGEEEPFEIVHLEDLIPDDAEMHLLATYYDVMELATAVKPLLLMHLLKQTADPVVYLDPDIQVYEQLDVVEKGAREETIALTPHTLAPYPRDGLRPTEAEILGAGVYNLGFIAVAQGAEDFLRWWWERLQRDSVVDPARMLFTDQRWVDFVPGLFPHVLLKDPGLNVAYWNLHGRTIERGDHGYYVNGEPLRFFHFSGYSPFAPEVLSKHTGDHPRVRLADSPVLAELAHAYGALLLAEGLRRGGGPLYGWDVADGGVRLDPAARRAYREAVLRAESAGGAGSLPPDPFEPGGGQALLAWLGAPMPGRRFRNVSRYLQAVYDMRPDLQAAFPEQGRGSEQQYIDWAIHGALGADRSPAERAVLTGHGRGAAASAETPSAAQPTLVGTRVGLPPVQAVGYFRAELGMGEYGRQLVTALRATGTSVGTTTWTESISRQQHPFEDEQSPSPAAVNLLVVNADQTPMFGRTAGDDFFRGRYTVGAWAWEVEDFPPAFDEAFSWVDEVWAISSFTRDAIARRTDKPVFAVPPPVQVPVVDRTVSRAQLGVPEGFIFLFSHDFLSVPRRKNAAGLVEAFSDAFTSAEGPTLVIKSINGDKQPAAQQELREAVASRNDILLLEDYLSPAEHVALIAHADCYVSLHRSEGFGLTMAESMALGKPVIATAYSGNMDFMSEGTSYLVPFDRVPVGKDAEPYPATSTWADPHLDVAAALMRQIWRDPDGAGEVGARAARHMAENHSPEARAALVVQRLSDIAGRLPEQPVDVDHTDSATRTAELSLSPLKRRVERARFLLHVARTPEIRRAAVRRRAGRLVSAGFGQNRRAIAEQEATRREVLTLRGRLDMVARDVDATSRRLTQLVTHEELAARSEEAASELRSAVARFDEHTRRLEGATARTEELVQGSTTRTEELLQGAAARTEELLQGATARTEELFEGATARTEELVRRADESRAQEETTSRRIEELSQRLNAVTRDVARIIDEIDAPPYMSDPDALLLDGLNGKTLGYGDGDGRTSYADFGDLFRGTEEFIRTRQRAYLPLLQDAPPLLDLGCGRGETLSLLAEAGVEVAGVDLDVSMVERCRAEGLPVTLGDAVAHLREVSPGSLGAVTSFQFIEHLSLDKLKEMMVLAHRALRPGGLLVAETVNPHSARALKAFWVDLTHRHPIYPEAALMLARDAGFTSAQILFPHGIGSFDRDRVVEGEYALVARR